MARFWNTVVEYSPLKSFESVPVDEYRVEVGLSSSVSELVDDVVEVEVEFDDDNEELKEVAVKEEEREDSEEESEEESEEREVVLMGGWSGRSRPMMS